MPSKQAAQTSKSTQQRGRAMSPASAATGERDENYNLISVLYHALQGAETIGQYINDAREADDDELVSFLEETRETYVEHANQAKQLLMDRLDIGSEEEEEEEEEEDEEEDEED